MIIEYLPGQTLEIQAAMRPMTADETIQLLHQCLQAVQFLHSMNLLHRDIKPDNILFQTRMPLNVKIADFGMVKVDTSAKTYCGTPMYLAKEVFEGNPYSTAVDIWSLGMVVLFCLQGIPSHVNGHRQGAKWCEFIAVHATILKDFATDSLC